MRYAVAKLRTQAGLNAVRGNTDSYSPSLILPGEQQIVINVWCAGMSNCIKSFFAQAPSHIQSSAPFAHSITSYPQMQNPPCTTAENKTQMSCTTAVCLKRRSDEPPTGAQQYDPTTLSHHSAILAWVLHLQCLIGQAMQRQ